VRSHGEQRRLAEGQATTIGAGLATDITVESTAPAHFVLLAAMHAA
jgi:hypothetical protein